VSSTCTDAYPCLKPVVYALDTLIPVVNLHQRDYWIPDVSSGYGLAIFTWGAIMLGWALVTLVVAGFTNLVRKE
jgi:hypothetical protein